MSNEKHCHFEQHCFPLHEGSFHLLANPQKIFMGHFPDEESPLWEISARDLTSKMQFEIVLTMEGITPETGNTIQVSGV